MSHAASLRAVAGAVATLTPILYDQASTNGRPKSATIKPKVEADRRQPKHEEITDVPKQDVALGVCASAVALALMPLGAAGQRFLDRPIRLVVPFAPGGVKIPSGASMPTHNLKQLVGFAKAIWAS
jgi:hypothetical protein